MATAWIECWKCDECGHRWIKTEIWPAQCASSKCRKRSWNHKSGDGATETRHISATDKGIREYPGLQVSNPAPPTKPDMAALRAICAGRVDAAVGKDSNSKIGGCPSVEIMRNDVKSPTAFDGEAAPNLCSHKEWAEDGEQYRCRLQAGHKGKCALGERVS